MLKLNIDDWIVTFCQRNWLPEQLTWLSGPVQIVKNTHKFRRLSSREVVDDGVSGFVDCQRVDDVDVLDY